jgi:hypothetical protein
VLLDVSHDPTLPFIAGQSDWSQHPVAAMHSLAAAHFFSAPHVKSHAPAAQLAVPPWGAAQVSHEAPHAVMLSFG